MTKRLNLLVAVTSSAKVFVNNVMAWSTDSHSVTDRIPKLWAVSPRFNMVDYGLSQAEQPITVLTSKIISSQASIAPFYIKDVVSPLNIVTSVLFSSRPFSLALLKISRLIRTASRAKSSLIRIIGINTEGLRTSLAYFVVVHNQYKDYSI